MRLDLVSDHGGDRAAHRWVVVRLEHVALTSSALVDLCLTSLLLLRRQQTSLKELVVLEVLEGSLMLLLAHNFGLFVL